jgi:leucyl-tRNA synthetase
MSKSRGNVVNPDEVIDAYGADAFRMYEMFIGPFDQTAMWSEDSLNGVYRFVNKIFALFGKVKPATLSAKDTQVMHKCIVEVSERIDQMKFNTAVSSLMTYVNYLSNLNTVPEEMYITLLKLVAPFAPHLAEEMWARLGKTSLIVKESWPKGNAELAKDNTITVAVQINGKMRGTIEVARDADKEIVIAQAKALENVAKQLAIAEPKKIIVVPNRIVNIVL